MWTPSTNCPVTLALALRDALKLGTFVETGTAQGDTAFIMAGHFEVIETVELSPAMIEIARGHLERIRGSSIVVLEGDSVKALENDVRGKPAPLFWLDAHYCGGTSARSELDCPVLQEIAVIRRRWPDAPIMVDDAHCFYADEAERRAKIDWSERPEQWPLLPEVVKALENDACNICVRRLGNVLVRLPKALTHLVDEARNS